MLDEALNAACKIGSEYHRGIALAELAKHLTADLLCQALDIARGIRNVSTRVSAMSALVEYLSATKQADVIDEALVEAGRIEDESARVHALGHLIPHLPSETKIAVIGEVLVAIRGMESDLHRASALCSLAGHLPARYLDEALELTHDIGDEEKRANALTSALWESEWNIDFVTLNQAMRIAINAHSPRSAAQIGTTDPRHTAPRRRAGIERDGPIHPLGS